MLNIRTPPGLRFYRDATVVPSLKRTRRAAGMSLQQMGIMLGVTMGSIWRWENEVRNHAAERFAWILYLLYIRPDPVNGWQKAALGLPPDGQIPPELAQIMSKKLSTRTQVAGYQRRSRWKRDIS